MELFSIIALIWLVILQGKVTTLTKQVNQLLQGQASTPPEPAPARMYPDVPAFAPQSVSPIPLPRTDISTHPEYAYAASTPSPFMEWLKEDLMMKIGALLLLIAFGWFVSYAFANNWIGEMGRIMLGLVSGALIMVLGLWRIVTHPHQGGVFTVLGSTTVILTLYAARELYDFFDPVSALGMMFLSIFFVAYVSVQYRRKYLALSSLVLAGLAPLLIAAEPSVTGLNLYLLVVVLGTLLVVYARGWSILTFTSFIIVFLYGLPILSLANGTDQFKGLFFAFIFTAVFFAANIVGLIINENEDNKNYHIFIAFGSGMYLILWVLATAPEAWQSLILAAWMVVFSTGTFLVYQAVGNKLPFYMYGATSVVLLGAATAMELNGPALTIAFTIEIMLLVMLSAIIFPKTNIASRLALLFALPLLLAVESIASSAWSVGLFHSDMAVLMVLTSALVSAGVFLTLQPDEDTRGAGRTLLSVGAIFVLVLLWLVLHAGTSPSEPAYEQGTIISLVLYTVIGIASYIIGVRTNTKMLATGGRVLIGLVIARLLVVDVWNMALAARIITFFVIGVLLISTAFIRRQKREDSSLV